jgi:CubicO group peptidase (beta-lactamase class C family)
MPPLLSRFIFERAAASSVAPTRHRMRLLSRLVVSVGSLLFVASGVAADASLSDKVDALFSAWAKPDSPGAVCAVIRDGEVIHARGYGMEDLEHDVPLSPDSVFYIASTSKQFTAASIALLVLDGKLSLDDDIRQHLPEMADRSPPITVRHLVHHTSGLRDYFALLGLTGWTDTDYFNNDMVVKLLARQRTLNFEPGTRHLYSNSNYVLLAEIVKRVSEKSLRQFADERIFQPLGMTHTHFDDDYRQIVKHRALSYAPKRGGGWQQLLKEFDGYGDGNLLTTVGDLARWDENFTTGKVGGEEFLKLILTRGALDSGKSLDYAFGLGHAAYRGLATVQHGGGFKGFRTEMVRFPGQQFTVIVLGNVATFNPGQMAQRVADLYLADQFTAPARAASRRLVSRRNASR